MSKRGNESWATGYVEELVTANRKRYLYKPIYARVDDKKREFIRTLKGQRGKRGKRRKRGKKKEKHQERVNGHELRQIGETKTKPMAPRSAIMIY